MLKESHLFVINSRKEIERKIIILAKNIKELGIEGMFVKPHVREIIEKESRRYRTEDEAAPAAETEEE